MVFLLGNSVLPNTDQPVWMPNQVLPTVRVKYAPRNLTIRLEREGKHIWNNRKQFTSSDTKVEQDFKGINDESDLETEGGERGLDKPALSLGQGGGALPKKGTGHSWG